MKFNYINLSNNSLNLSDKYLFTLMIFLCLCIIERGRICNGHFQVLIMNYVFFKPHYENTHAYSNI